MPDTEPDGAPLDPVADARNIVSDACACSHEGCRIFLAERVKQLAELLGLTVTPTGPAYVWTYNDDDGEEFTGPYATEALARAEAEAEYIGSYTDPASAGTLSWSMLENTPDCYILREDGKSVGIHLWRQEILTAPADATGGDRA